MTIDILPDYQALSRKAADLVAEVIRSQPASLICIASGHTPVGVFQCLVEDVKKKKLDIGQAVFVSLDEWLGIPPHLPGSCRNMMDKDFFVPLSIHESQIVFFDGMSATPEKECDRVNGIIEKHGGLDVMLVGIGMNGHIAMNEPGTSIDSYAHVADLAEETKVVGQKYFSDQTTLTKGLTLGLRHLRDAKLPILMANGSKKAAIVAKALKQPPTVDVPASVIQAIANAVVLLDVEAAGLMG